MKGVLLVLEGLDGCGKTTQGNILKEALEKRGCEVIFAREPGGTAVSERLREIILDKSIADMHPVTEAYLYAASRCQLVHEVILPALKEGKVVLLDRFLLSSVAYQGYGRELGEEAVRRLNEAATAGIEPDLTILFDMERREDRLDFDRDRMELSSKEFFDKVYKGYMSAYDKDKTLVVDATRSIEEISEQIMARVGALLDE